MKNKPLENVRSLERGMKILQCFKNHISLSLTEIAVTTGLSVTTCNRLIQTLVEMECLEKNFQKKYVLGPQIYKFMDSLIKKNDMAEIANDSLKRIKNIFNETASLYIEQSTNRVCIAKVESTHALRRTVKVGEVLPLSRGAVGEMFMAYMDETKRNELLPKGMDYPTDYFKNIKLKGYAINDGRQEEGVYAIAAPVLNHEGEIVSVLSISGPSERIRKFQSELVRVIREEAGLLSEKMESIF
ncbi:hypothetical protein C3V36_00630 [Lachnospiraceae bacterium oral taxon 500]|nr:hypothetical protein C3V36_00630 [Lachnospiraceae bacterium oral taxon 500]